ncbi:hypothetical protein HPULCUR_002800 [Helicostylum pulchrum]|uniref:Uncharacterized protein n=1 Tax=Helicostylum pulchrum TaxID=562976 RepID=A0ABP9XRM4_9FUNG
MRMTAEQAACSIYGLEVSYENCVLAMKLLRDAYFEPVTVINGDPTFAMAISKKKLNMEPWKFERLIPTHDIMTDATNTTHDISKTSTTSHTICQTLATVHNVSQTSTVATDEYEIASDNSSNISQPCISIAPSQSGVIDLCK